MFFEKMQTRKNDGFTLVELIVVIAILAILAGIAVPAYSGYIEKANVAADEQLLHAVNIAFASAAAEHAGGTVTDAVLSYGSNDSGVTVTGVASVSSSGTPNVDALKTAFATYYGTNNASAFKTVSSLIFNRENQMFMMVSLSDDFVAVLEKLVGSENVPVLLESIFGDMGAAPLMGKVAYTSDLAAALLSSSDGKFTEMIINCSSAMAEMMGLDPGSEEFASIAKNMLMEKMNQLKTSDPKYADVDLEELYDKLMNTENPESPSAIELELYKSAQNSISANNAILAAAQKSEEAFKNIFTTLKGNPTGNLVSAVDKGIEAGDTREGLAQVAMAYGLYTAYAERNNLTVSDNPADVLSALSDPGFQTYLDTEDAQKDLAGYQASMNMINESVQGNSGAVSDVLINGFDDPQLIAVLQQALAQGSNS